MEDFAAIIVFSGYAFEAYFNESGGFSNVVRYAGDKAVVQSLKKLLILLHISSVLSLFLCPMNLKPQPARKTLQVLSALSGAFNELLSRFFGSIAGACLPYACKAYGNVSKATEL